MFTLTCKFCDSIFVVVIREIKKEGFPLLVRSMAERESSLNNVSFVNVL